MTNAKTIHKNHRQRLNNRMKNINAMQSVDILEYILTYVIPRKNTNPIAHQLLNKFKSVYNVLNADPKEIAKVPGMGKTSAERLVGIKDIFDNFTISKHKNNIYLDLNKDLTDYCINLVAKSDFNELVVVSFDKNFKILQIKSLPPDQRLTKFSFVKLLSDNEFLHSVVVVEKVSELYFNLSYLIGRGKQIEKECKNMNHNLKNYFLVLDNNNYLDYTNALAQKNSILILDNINLLDGLDV